MTMFLTNVARDITGPTNSRYRTRNIYKVHLYGDVYHRTVLLTFKTISGYRLREPELKKIVAPIMRKYGIDEYKLHRSGMRRVGSYWYLSFETKEEVI